MTKTKPSLPPVRVKIEIPRDSEVKYEMDKKTGVMVVDRILKEPLPYNYGFVPDTLWDDGDALDAIVLGEFSLHPGVELDARPIGVVKMYDNGKSDWKLVCTVLGQPSPPTWPTVVRDYLSNYKPGVKIRGLITDEKAIYEVVVKARRTFQHREDRPFWDPRTR